MKRFLTNLILIISILSILVIPSFAATTSDSDDIVILKQPTDVFCRFNSSSGYWIGTVSVIAIGENLSYQWQYSFDGVSWTNYNTSSSRQPTFRVNIESNEGDTFLRCRISSDENYVYSRMVLAEISPTNIFNFVGSCLRYITSYISLIINSLITPGAPLYALLPVLCIGIAVSVLLIVIKITKGFSWGM